MTRNKPRTWLWLLLTAALLATAWLAINQPQDVPIEVVSARGAAAPAGLSRGSSGASPVVVWPQRVTRAAAEAWPRLSQTATASWGTPPPPPPPPRVAAVGPPPAPAPLQAPPFPYQLVGRLERADGQRALLTNDVSTQAVAVGAVVDGQWRVDKLDRNSMSVTWLPGEQTRRVVYGNSR